MNVQVALITSWYFSAGSTKDTDVGDFTALTWPHGVRRPLFAAAAKIADSRRQRRLLGERDSQVLH